MQMVITFAENDVINQIFYSIDPIVNSTFAILATVEGYKYSEYFQGLLFGIYGSNFILSLGDILNKVKIIS